MGISRIVSHHAKIKKYFALAGTAAAAVAIPIFIVYGFMHRPQIAIRVVGDGESQPIPVGWGEQLLQFNIENYSPTPIEFESLATQFSASENFQLMPSTDASAHRGKIEQAPTFSIEFSSIPNLKAGEDLHTGVFYRASRSTIPFELTFVANAKISREYINTHLKYIPANVREYVRFPSTRISRTVKYLPNGRNYILTVPARPKTNFTIYGPATKAPSTFFTSDVKDETVITCYGYRADGSMAVETIHPMFIPMCK